MKKYIGAVVLFIALFITACGSESNIYGTWSLEKIEHDGTSYTIDEIKSIGEDAVGSDVMSMIDTTLVIKESSESNSGTAFIIAAGQNASVDWSVDGDTVKIGVQEAKLDGDYLILSPNDDAKMYFKKTSDSQDITEVAANSDSEDTKEQDSEEASDQEDSEIEENLESDDNSEDTEYQDSESNDVILTGDEYTYDDFLCRDNDQGNVIIVRYDGDDDNPRIPSEIDDKPVVEIGTAAFSGNTKIRNITNWADIEQIGAFAFKDCTSLKEFSVSSGVEEIKESTFEGCSSMSKVYLWGDIRIFGKNAFKNCTSLKEVSISSYNEEVGESAFEGCSKLTKVYFWGGETIKAAAFKNCTSIKELSLGSEIETIESEAFYGCTSLKEVTLWNRECDVAGDAFDNCPKLEERP